TLSGGQQQRVAVGSVLTPHPRVLVLDEPTSALDPPAAEEVLAVLQRLVHDLGTTVLMAEHRLERVIQYADRVALLPAPGAPPVLALDGVSTLGAGPVDLELRAGEALGLVGLSGAGHMDLGRALAGARPLLGGQVLLDGDPYRPRTVADAVRRGVALVPGDRQREGWLPELTVRENLLANPRAGDGPAPRWISPRRERATAAALVERFSVRPRDSEAPIAVLSGGNQQKVMIGRWLRTGLRLLILEEPTASVDIGAKAAVHRLLGEAQADGLAVLLISTDFE
ncbi:ATP-binding cassette domain-containing protein, partial [Streptomyces stelliscabiei]|uniref:ATP-binding cassette domain-containing protein n=1 Tax=Streptomyces stelliscabiei TaxID=146820 RepID=UPI00062C5230